MDDACRWAYLAGFTDGDGCITLETSKGTYQSVRVRWAQKESESAVLDWISDFLISQGIKAGLRRFSVATAGHKYPQRELTIANAADSRLVLRHLLPYLVVKRRRAEEALAILDEVRALKEQYGPKYRIRSAGCSYEGCDQPYFSSGKCAQHYSRDRYARDGAKWNAARKARRATSSASGQRPPSSA